MQIGPYLPLFRGFFVVFELFVIFPFAVSRKTAGYKGRASCPLKSIFFPWLTGTLEIPLPEVIKYI